MTITSARSGPAAPRAAPGGRDVAADPRSVDRPGGAELAPLLDGLATCVIWLDADGVVVGDDRDRVAVEAHVAVGRGLEEVHTRRHIHARRGGAALGTGGG